MKNLQLIVAFCVTGFVTIGYGQQSPNLKTLVDAENAFADRAITANVRQAFLDFLDTSAVVFEDGKF